MDETGVWTAAILEAFRHYLHEHPFARSYRGGGNGGARQLTDVMPPTEWQRTAIYNESFRPTGVDSEMVVWLPARRPLEITVAVHRCRRSFTERDRLILDLVRPHLAQAHRNAVLLGQLRSAIEAGPHGLVLVDERARPVFVSERARGYLDRYFGPKTWSLRRLPDPARQWLQRHQQSFSAASDVPLCVAPHVVNRDGCRLSIRWCNDDRHVLLLEEQRTRPADSAAFEALGLSRREAEVLGWIAQGKTNEEIGTILSLSPRTVAKHLERMYPRLGVENRTAAAARALEFLKSPREA